MITTFGTHFSVFPTVYITSLTPRMPYLLLVYRIINSHQCDGFRRKRLWMTGHITSLSSVQKVHRGTDIYCKYTKNLWGQFTIVMGLWRTLTWNLRTCTRCYEHKTHPYIPINHIASSDLMDTSSLPITQVLKTSPDVFLIMTFKCCHHIRSCWR